METLVHLNQPMPIGGSGVPRSTKYQHLTPIIKQYLNDIGENPFTDDTPVDDLWKLFEPGFVWEEALTNAFGTHVVGVRPPEVVLDGIACSPDGLEFEDSLDGELLESLVRGPLELNTIGSEELLSMGTVKALHEFKYTKRSIPSPKGEQAVIDKFQENPYWMLQACGYLKVVGCTKCFHHVCHLNGDYSQNRGLVYVVYETDFEQEEIDQAWGIFQRYVK